MVKLGIITADGARARFFTAEAAADPDLDGSPRLEEHANLVHPLGELPEREKYSDRPSRKPSGRGPSGASPASDDHRQRHDAEDTRRFARTISEAALRFVQEQALTRVVLAAEPRKLGALRGELNGTLAREVDLVELPLELSAAGLPQLREALTQRGLLPEPRLPRGGVFRPRGQEPSTR